MYSIYIVHSSLGKEKRMLAIKPMKMDGMVTQA